MADAVFQIDWTALLLLLLAFPLALWLWRRRRRQARAALLYSQVAKLGSVRTWRMRLARLPSYLLLAATMLFALAFVDPYFLLPLESADPADQEIESAPEAKDEPEEVELPTEGVAIYLVLDRSGSMAEPVDASSKKGQRRIDALKEVTSQFVRGNARLGLVGRRNDMMGLIAFARVAEVISPLTLDHRALLEKLLSLDVVSRQTQDGTAIGYALFKTVNLIAATDYFAKQLESEGKPAYEIKSKVIVLVTDGLQSPHPLDQGHDLRTIDLPQAADYAAQEGIRVYVVSIEPRIMHPRFRNEAEALANTAEQTGGKFFLAEDSTQLLAVYQEIDSLERSLLPDKIKLQAEVEEKRLFKADEDSYERYSLYPTLIAWGLVLFLFSVVLETTVLRRLP